MKNMKAFRKTWEKQDFALHAKSLKMLFSRGKVGLYVFLPSWLAQGRSLGGPKTKPGWAIADVWMGQGLSFDGARPMF